MSPFPALSLVGGGGPLSGRNKYGSIYVINTVCASEASPRFRGKSGFYVELWQEIHSGVLYSTKIVTINSAYLPCHSIFHTCAYLFRMRIYFILVFKPGLFRNTAYRSCIVYIGSEVLTTKSHTHTHTHTVTSHQTSFTVTS
jgi:hypothetical protein